MPSRKPILSEQFLRDDLEEQVFCTVAEPRPDRVGVEVELFPLIRSQLGTASAQPEREKAGSFLGLYPWLLLLAERYGWTSQSVESSAALAFKLQTGGTVTLEPGGQIEYSSPPFEHPEQALEDAAIVEKLLCSEGERVGLWFETGGFNRWLGGNPPQLVVQKPRYLVMDQHFQKTGPYGRMMMRQTCATQINLDFGSVEKMERRWRLANLASPALNALFANAPHEYNGTHFKSFRYEIWRHTDPCRTGALPGLLEADPVTAWLQLALDASVMLVPSEQEGFRAPCKPVSFRGWMNGEADSSDGFPDLDDWHLHLTTLFPDVRPRGFLELRLIDGLPAQHRTAAVVLATSLLYNDGLLGEGLRLLSSQAKISERSEKERFLVGKALLECAAEETGHAALREYYHEFALQGITPADQADVNNPVSALIPQS